MSQSLEACEASISIPIVYVCSIMSNSLQPCESKPARLLSLWDFSGKNTGVGCHSLTRGSSQPRDWTQVSCIGSHILYQWDTWKALPIVLIRKQSQREMHSLTQVHCNLHKTKSGSQPSSGWLSPLIWGTLAAELNSIENINKFNNFHASLKLYPIL